MRSSYGTIIPDATDRADWKSPGGRSREGRPADSAWNCWRRPRRHSRRRRRAHHGAGHRGRDRRCDQGRRRIEAHEVAYWPTSCGSSIYALSPCGRGLLGALKRFGWVRGHSFTVTPHPSEHADASGLLTPAGGEGTVTAITAAATALKTATVSPGPATDRPLASSEACAGNRPGLKGQAFRGKVG